MKHIWWGTLTMMAVLVAAWTALIISGHPHEAHEAAVAIWAPAVCGFTLLTVGLFAGALDG